FLLAVTLKVFGIALLAALGFLLAGVLVLGSTESRTRGRVRPWVRKHRRLTVIAAVAVGLTCLALGVVVQSQLGLPNAVACLKNRGMAFGGGFNRETDDRTYVGEIRTDTSPGRIASIPNEEVGPVFIGGKQDDGEAICSAVE